MGSTEIGHHYGKEHEPPSCASVTTDIRNCASILMLLLLGILIILGISGYSIKITIADGAPTFSRIPPPNDPEFPPSGPSTFTFKNLGAILAGNDPFSLAPFLEHERNGEVTAEEDAVLRAVFAEFDGDGDGLWDYDDFSNFMEVARHSGRTFTFMDKTNDGFLDYDELVTFFIAFNSVPLFHTDTMNELVIDATGLPLEEAQELQPQVLATLIYEDIEHGEEGILKEQWIEYVVATQWAQFHDDMNSLIDFAEFERDLFESQMFLDWQECRHEEECANPHAAVQAFHDAEIVHHTEYDLESMRRRLQPLEHYTITHMAAVTDDCSERTKRVYGGCACYDDLSFVSVKREGPLPEVVTLRDVAVGDFVFDGNEFTKVYYVHEHRQDVLVNMLEIKYGVPSDEQSITLTPKHLLYLEAAPLPVRSDQIKIGDVLSGFTEYPHGTGSNFTVYGISTVRKIPVNPITMSGDMVVNGIKTSVFIRSVEWRDAVQDATSIIRWISKNIDEKLAQNIWETLKATIGTLMTEEMMVWAVSSGAVSGIVYVGIHLVIGIAVFKTVGMLFNDRKTKKQN